MAEKWNKLWGKATESLDRHYKLSVLMTLIAYYATNVTAGFIKGGRWDLYQHIATADRFLNGQGFYYSTTEASSPYFPGVAFLTIFIGGGVEDAISLERFYFTGYCFSDRNDIFLCVN
ncbi:MAG: hypothetical protein NC302_07115 [Bacteroidales bacterium]|nr:hypothetical protein [Bacteroidales bacterium]MCM1414707.1 hypothetical protein [bacterium]MCM1422516.1 hypothetical protein [bacterium]